MKLSSRVTSIHLLSLCAWFAAGTLQHTLTPGTARDSFVTPRVRGAAGARTADGNTAGRASAATLSQGPAKEANIKAPLVDLVHTNASGVAVVGARKLTTAERAKAREVEALTDLSAQQQCNIIALYGPTPANCAMGNDRFSPTQLYDHVSIFMGELRQQQAHLPSHCCMGINHEFAMSFIVHALQPAVIIESGVAAGHGTFMLRLAAGPTTPIISIDPGDPAMSYPHGVGGFGNWKDTSGYTQYFVGPTFKDLSELDLGALIPDPAMRARTLVILDDHQSCVERFRLLQRWGIKWAFYEDNYPFHVATSADAYSCPDLGASLVRDFDIASYLPGDAYSPNTACGGPVPLASTSVLYKDKFGSKCSQLSLAQNGKLVSYLQQNLATYFEFPPLFTPCHTARAPILGQDPAILASLGLPAVEHEIWTYGHLFPSFVELQGPDPGDPLAVR